MKLLSTRSLYKSHVTSGGVGRGAPVWRQQPPNQVCIESHIPSGDAANGGGRRQDPKLHEIYTKVLIALCAIFLFYTSSAHAYLLPDYKIAPSEQGAAAEDILNGYKQSLSQLASYTTLKKIESHRKNPKIRLAKAEQSLVRQYDGLNTAIEFWRQVVELKKDLSVLHSTPQNKAVAIEADLIAKSVIGTIYELSQKWRVGGSALFNNLLINHGLKEKGFCFHYVEELEKALNKIAPKHFDMHEVSAWAGTFRENNALVLTAKGEGFESGIAIDAWRRGGRPFWTNVKGDRFPWQKAMY